LKTRSRGDWARRRGAFPFFGLLTISISLLVLAPLQGSIGGLLEHPQSAGGMRSTGARAAGGGVPTSAGTLAGPDYPTQPSGNFSIHVPAPRSPTPHGAVILNPGSSISVEYHFSVQNYSSKDLNLVVQVPQTVAIFPLGRNGSTDLRVFDPSRNISVTGPGNTSGSLTESSLAITTQETFDTSGQAILSTQQVAVTSSLPWGSVVLGFAWMFTFTYNKTYSNSSAWSGGLSPGVNQTVIPGETVALVSAGPSTMTSGNYFVVCLGGMTLGGRNFSLDLGTLNGTIIVYFTQVNESIPVAPLPPYCWQAWVPAWVAPSQIIRAQVWTYENLGSRNQTSLMLYLFLVKIIPASTSGSSGFLGVSDQTWLEVGLILFFILVIAVALLWTYRRTRPPPTTDSTVGGVAEPTAEPGQPGPVPAWDETSGAPGERRLR